MTIWFSSDPHIGHQNILKYQPLTRKFDTVESMNDRIKEKWLSQIKPGDEVWLIGDIFFLGEEEAVAWLSNFKHVKIHLVLGNHDSVIKKSQTLQKMFASIQEYKTLKIDGKHVVLSHFPFAIWDRKHYGAYHLHGHSHGNYQGEGRIMDVGVDCHPENGLFSFAEIVTKLEPIEFSTK